MFVKSSVPLFVTLILNTALASGATVCVSSPTVSSISLRFSSSLSTIIDGPCTHPSFTSDASLSSTDSPESTHTAVTPATFV